ncbi:MAG TPA: ABC transporter ATP-binding protein [Polyangia bacterium]|nr:ABC transporter ATP-binding protein [Polyangia bacterium]
MRVLLENVVKTFDDRDGKRVTVLGGISLEIPSGGALVLAGPSGSGKSTLLNVIAGLHPVDAGSVLVGDTRLDELSETRRDRFRARHVGYVFQTFNLLSPMSCVENVVVPAGLAGVGRPDDEERARLILTDLHLGAHLHKRPFELSVGQRQRVAVARALLRRPDVLLADEPTASLDPESAEVVATSLAELSRAGTTLVLATHDPALRAAFDAPVFELGAGEERS